MRIATFNILHGQMVNGARQHSAAHLGPPAAQLGFEPLTDAIQSLNPDIIAIQELDHLQERSGNHAQAQVVAEAIDAAHVTFLPTVIGTPGGRLGFRSSTAHEQDLGLELDTAAYGIALISKQQPIRTSTLTFPAAPLGLPLLVQQGNRPKIIQVRDEPRAVIASVFASSQSSAASGYLTVVTAHLSFVPGFNYRQLRRIANWLSGFPRPLIFVGDFNLPGRLPMRATGFEPLFTGETYPSYKPWVQFDHLLADGFAPAQLAAMREGAQRWSLEVSDHCALTVDL